MSQFEEVQARDRLEITIRVLRPRPQRGGSGQAEPGRERAQ